MNMPIFAWLFCDQLKKCPMLAPRPPIIRDLIELGCLIVEAGVASVRWFWEKFK